MLIVLQGHVEASSNAMLLSQRGTDKDLRYQ
jgi:hypothetical protein